jgi:shikimate dehydrogenase
MKRAAVLGHPIEHSLSPKLHGYWLKKYSIEGSYEAIDTPPEALEERLKELSDKGYSGVNLTVPLKETVIPLLSSSSQTAQMIGAVNTLTFTPQGYHGDNTDAYGFIQNLKSSVNLYDYKNHAIIIGAGGAAKAIIAGLLQEGFPQLTLINRTRARAEALQAMSEKIRVIDWQDREEIISEASLLVNTTSLGMKNQPELELSLSALPQTALVTDIVYNPLQTYLLQQASDRGNLIVQGLGMLIHQAVPAFEAFFGREPQPDPALEEALL